MVALMSKSPKNYRLGVSNATQQRRNHILNATHLGHLLKTFCKTHVKCADYDEKKNNQQPFPPVFCFCTK